jgi:DNA-binding response OmpR family regulator
MDSREQEMITFTLVMSFDYSLNHISCRCTGQNRRRTAPTTGVAKNVIACKVIDMSFLIQMEPKTCMSDLILVVDDNEMNRDMLSRRLKRQGYQVQMAENGQTALDMLHENQYALVLLDVMMPRMNGYEVLETVKANPDTKHIPIIMISAVDDLDSVVKCIELGADDYLFKPFNPILLKARVQASLQRINNRTPTEMLKAPIEKISALATNLKQKYPDDDQIDNLAQQVRELNKLITN